MDNDNPFDAIRPPLPLWEPKADPSTIEIPGLDTSASLNDQIDQMDQLITIKLQNIDANFQKIQNVLANRILPAFRRYEEATEPARKAAQFWVSFFEAAANISMPMNQDVSGVTDSIATSTDETATFSQQEDTFDPDDVTSTGKAETFIHEENSAFNPAVAAAEGSFAPTGGFVSSTPMHPRPPSSYNDSSSFANLNTMSLESNPMETPLQRLGREIKNLDAVTPDSPSKLVDISATPTTIFTRPAQQRSTVKKSIPKERNPFIPHGVPSRKWDGIVDLANSPGVPRLSSPRKYNQEEDDLDDSDTLWPPGMSPLQTIKIDMPGVPKPTPRARHKTEASKKIMNDLLASVASERMSSLGIGSGLNSYTSSSQTPSLTGINWGRTKDTSSSQLSIPPVLESVGKGKGKAQPAQLDRNLMDSAPPAIRYNDEDRSDDGNDDESLEYDKNGGAFQFLIQHAKPADDTRNSDSSSDEDGVTVQPGQLQMLEYDDSFDDSFDNDIEGTGTNLFAPKGSGDGRDARNFKLRGQNLLDDTLGIGDVIKAKAGPTNTPWSPTPYGTLGG